MAATRISNAAAKAACDAITALIGTAGRLKLYTGTQPADPDTAVSGTLLADIALANPAFGAATDANPGGRASASGLPIADTSADAGGTAAWFRVSTSGGVAVWDGSIGIAASGADMILNSTTISLGANVQITSWTFTIPET